MKTTAQNCSANSDRSVIARGPTFSLVNALAHFRNTQLLINKMLPRCDIGHSIPICLQIMEMDFQYRNGRNRNRGYNSLQNFYVRFKIGRGFNMEEVIIYKRDFQIFLYSTIIAQIIHSIGVVDCCPLFMHNIMHSAFLNCKCNSAVFNETLVA